MPLKIRLSRGGNKKRPHYRIVLADSRAPRDGKFIERLGTYNPLLSKDNDQRIVFNEERIKPSPQITIIKLHILRETFLILWSK